MEPAQWPVHRLRRVLDAAVHSPVGARELAEAAAACEADPRSSSFSRHTSSFAEPEAGAAAVPEEEEGGGDGGSEPLPAAAGPGAAGPRAPPLGAGVPGGQAAELDEAAELAKHAAELDDETLRMVMELEQGWGAGSAEQGEGGAAAADPYAALTP